jgi:hypothetical protein
MPAGDMAKFMRDDALHLGCTFGHIDKAAVNVNRLPARNKGINRGIIDQNDVDILGIKPRCCNQRARHIMQKRLSFGIAQHGLRCHRLEGEGACSRESCKARGAA